MPRDLQQYFRIEARELLDGLRQGLIRQRGGGGSDEDRRQLARLAHTLNGASRIAAHQGMVDAVRRLEDELGAVHFDTAAAAEALARLDEVQGILASLEAPATPADADAAGPAEMNRQAREAAAVLDAAGQEALDRLTAEIAQVRGDGGGRQRLAPIDSIRPSLEQAMRETADALGTEVRLEMTGGDRRIDADGLSLLCDALVQLVRNAVAHGIEAPAARAARGKPATGSIRIDVQQAGGRLAISCRDDGRGMDVASIRAGLSGRGVGRTIVRDVADRLKGEVRIATDMEKGTTVRIEVPISLASLAALEVVSGDARALVPLDAVRSVVRLAASATAGAAATVLFDRETVPLVSLRDAFGMAGQDEEDRFALIVDAIDGRIALGVRGPGRVMQTLTRALPPLAAMPPIAGAIADGADGQVVPVVDPVRLRDALPPVGPV